MVLLRARVHALYSRGVAAHSALTSCGAHAGAQGVTLQVDDRLYAWEAMSLLLASDDLPADTQAHVLRGLLQHLCAQVTSNLAGDTSSFAVMASSPTAPALLPRGRLPRGGGVATGVVPAETMMLNHALEAVARLSKGFSHERMTRRRPQVGAPPVPHVTHEIAQRFSTCARVAPELQYKPRTRGSGLIRIVRDCRGALPRGARSGAASADAAAAQQAPPRAVPLVPAPHGRMPGRRPRAIPPAGVGRAVACAVRCRRLGGCCAAARAAHCRVCDTDRKPAA